MPPPRKKSEYKKSWEEDARFKEWVRPVKSDIHSFWCLCCEKKLSLSQMYKHSLTDHLENETWNKAGALEEEQARFNPVLCTEGKSYSSSISCCYKRYRKVREEKASEQGDSVWRRRNRRPISNQCSCWRSSERLRI